MKIIRLIRRYFQIDKDFMVYGKFHFNKIVSVITVNFSAIMSILGVNIPAYIDGKKVVADKKLTMKTFLTGIYDFWFESKQGSIFTNSKPIIFDVGANIGQFMVGCKNNVSGAIVHSFEPDPDTYNYLKTNSDKYKNVFANNCALSDSNGHLDFYKSSVSSEWSSLIKPYSGDAVLIKVDSLKLDDYVNKNKIKAIDLLKIDVEGAEMLVLKGSSKALSITKFLIIEASIDRSEKGMRASDVLALLFEAGFEIDSVGRIFREKVGAPQSSANIVLRNSGLVTDAV